MKTQHSAFLILSEHLTGFDSVELMGTGMLDDYYVCLMENIGTLDPARLWSIAEKLDSLKKVGNEAALAREIRHSLFSDAAIEPISKNIIRLWYTGTWRMKSDDPFSTVVVSPEAYQEGLIWKVAHTHPPGAKQPGFGSWGEQPR